MIGAIYRRAAIALALAAGTGAANAQTLITREITNEPVETIIESGPAGTVITRRPLAATSRPSLGYPAETVVSEPVEEVVVPRETVGVSTRTVAPAAETVTTRRVTTQRARTASPPRQVRTGQPAQTRQATIRRTAPAVPAARLEPVEPAFTAAQRSRIYRAVLQERSVPRTVVTEPYAEPALVGPAVRQDVIADRVVIEPAAPVVGERYVTVPAQRETFGFAPRVVERVVTTELGIGSRVPRTVPLYALPASVTTSSLRPYRYAIVDDRVFLVDPATELIVSEITE
jgi:hypothetical protein